jgi:hypothetical protein
MKALHLAHGKHFLLYFILIRILEISYIHTYVALEGDRDCVSYVKMRYFRVKKKHNISSLD